MPANKTKVTAAETRKVLNVGGNNKAIALPACFDGWQHDLLDIDPRGNPDVLCDARELWKLPPRQYDAIYCSHNLEHYHRHDVVNVLKGFRIVLKKYGFIFVRVPDLQAVMDRVIDEGLDIDDVLYVARCGPVLVRDVFYGYHVEIERSGNDFYAHKTGFTERSLAKILTAGGFTGIKTICQNLEIIALAFLTQPDKKKLTELLQSLPQ